MEANKTDVIKLLHRHIAEFDLDITIARLPVLKMK